MDLQQVKDGERLINIYKQEADSKKVSLLDKETTLKGT